MCAYIVTVSHCYTRGTVQTPRNPKRPQPMGHMNSTVSSLACGYVATVTRAPQPSRHNRRSDCSPSGSNYPYISKECWPLCEPRFILLRVLQPAQWGRPPTFSTQTCRRDGDRERERIPFHKRSCPKTSGPTVLYSILHPNSEGQGAVGQSHFLCMGLTMLKTQVGVEEVSSDLLICSMIDHRALSGALPLHIPPVFIL